MKWFGDKKLWISTCLPEINVKRIGDKKLWISTWHVDIYLGLRDIIERGVKTHLGIKFIKNN